MPERPAALRVVIDARPLRQTAGGFRSYVRALIVGLDQFPSEGNGILLYVDRPLPPDCAHLVPRRAQVCVLHPSRLRTDLRSFACQIKRDAPDIVHGTVNYLPPGLPASVCQTVAIHDAFGIKACPWDEPLYKWTLRHRAINRYWALMTRKSARRAHRIITVSEGSKQELLSALPDLSADKITVIYNGITLAPPLPSAGPRDAGRVLVIAALDGRKNGAVVARAFGPEERGAWGSHPVPGLDVVCGSPETARRADALLRKHGVQNFRLHSHLNDDALAAAYARVGAFVWPSRGEGFGLPPLEALHCGCPVLSSSAPAMPEVLGDAPVYFNPDDAHDLAVKTARLLADPDEMQERSEQGKRHAQFFTPERMARAHCAVWEAAAGAMGRGTGEK